MTTEPETIAVEFRNMEGLRVAIRPDAVEAVQELDRGCTLVTSNDVYRVDHPYPQVVGILWPEILR